MLRTYGALRSGWGYAGYQDLAPTEPEWINENNYLKQEGSYYPEWINENNYLKQEGSCYPEWINENNYLKQEGS